MDFNNKDPDNVGGGADGCIDFQDPDNAGLKGCMLQAVTERDSSDVSLELMWQDFCSEVSIADFFVIAAEALMEATAPSSSQAMWGQSFANNFRFGRQTAFECHPEELPNPINSCDAVEDVFMNRMGLTATGATALMGVHTLGRALPENSGYDGFWVSQQHARTFSPQYYGNMIAIGWRSARSSGGKMQWIRADVGPPNPLAGEMMLNTDMCLAFQTGDTPPWTRAEDTNHTNCCLWVETNSADLRGVTCHCQGQDISRGCTHTNCCIRSMGACRGNNPFRNFVRRDAWPHARTTLQAVSRYANEQSGTQAWHDDFIPVWKQTTEQGHELC